MAENRQHVSAGFKPLRTDCAEAPWVEVRGKRILLVEDEEPLRAWLRMLLEMEGHQVTEAGNGAEALDRFNSGHFDLVITDFEMPVMNGNLLAVRIKRSAPSLPILMITASSRARRDPDNPVDALLGKPFTAPDVYSALRVLLSVPPEAAQPSVARTLESPSVALVPEGPPSGPPSCVAVSCCKT